eukprot:NODE_10814_length_1327_cov_3.262500.p1 GENE.NODE_10814_length_1327_cov_3.262500~~NODE_10814_length_1327_cov_3.262500.p1  ORF type:complete len:215 (+),score=58.65 NODE_10814_length_1327_cov_3.262500:450-1094(+)
MGEKRFATWYIFVVMTAALMWLVAVFIGDYVYNSSLLQYYRLGDYNYYENIDPATTFGQEVLDAGRITFTLDTFVNVSLSEGYRQGSIYCVAPIMTNTTPSSYDFWAVGKNCCTGTAPDFACPCFDNFYAHSGVRELDETTLGYYKQAVAEAVVAYGIVANYPLFFEFLEDPSLSDVRDTGVRDFGVACVSALVAQAFLVAAATLAFSKIEYTP